MKIQGETTRTHFKMYKDGKNGFLLALSWLAS